MGCAASFNVVYHDIDHNVDFVILGRVAPFPRQSSQVIALASSSAISPFLLPDIERGEIISTTSFDANLGIDKMGENPKELVVKNLQRPSAVRKSKPLHEPAHLHPHPIALYSTTQPFICSHCSATTTPTTGDNGNTTSVDFYLCEECDYMNCIACNKLLLEEKREKSTPH